MPGRRISVRQLELLVEWAEEHRMVALGRFTGGALAAQTVRQAWEQLALRLNSVAQGASKSVVQWRRYWIEFKAKTKSKAADSRRSASATGAGPSRVAPLSELEDRVLAVIGRVAVEGLRGVRIPINIPSTAPPLAASVPSATPSEVEMDEEWLEEEDCSPIPPPSSEHERASPRPAQAITPRATPPIAGSSQPMPAPLNEQEPRQTRPQRPPRRFRDAGPPRWAVLLEERHIAAEERIAAAMEQHAAAQEQQAVAMHQLVASHQQHAALMERIAAAQEDTVLILAELRDGVRQQH